MSSPHSPLIPTFSHHHCHEEKHFQSHEIVRDLIIGISDGLTVPFALSAGTLRIV
ncbi:hypothetical protein HMI56_006024 [Coelomomyces lativittatus]|nr:hypothetical protein HMI56_006024 [Coelomomyces lativittatus]